ncbi:hypothetical protein [Vibrio fluvialis]|uniref:hypothetical protein n=1 Tax=Vibrio fluvialis TaxID=676 RepID=UPI001ED92B58|nr:hypothetical protein [Vibrio fluvialis]
MDINIRLNIYKYVFTEFVYIAFLSLVLFGLSSGSNQWLGLFVFAMCIGTTIRVFMLWRKLRNSALKTSGGRLFFKGIACDVTQPCRFLPFGIWSTAKVSYFEDSMQKRSIYIPKSALSHEHWQQVLGHRT